MKKPFVFALMFLFACGSVEDDISNGVPQTTEAMKFSMTGVWKSRCISKKAKDRASGDREVASLQSVIVFSSKQEVTAGVAEYRATLCNDGTKIAVRRIARGTYELGNEAKIPEMAGVWEVNFKWKSYYQYDQKGPHMLDTADLVKFSLVQVNGETLRGATESEELDGMTPGTRADRFTKTEVYERSHGGVDWLND